MSLAKEIKTGKINTVRHEALLNIVRTADIIEKLGSAFFSQFGITGAQYNLLIVLKLQARSLTQVEIGERLIASRANVTALVDRLEKKNYVRRVKVEKDRRIYHIELTPQGKDVLEKAEKAYVREVEKRMFCLSKEDSVKLSAILSKLRKDLTRENEI